MISVITPVLNSARFIREAVESVLAQNYGDFEHIVVDGGSTDGTQDILASYPHLRWTSGHDRGQSDAMNKGFAASKGEVVVYLNADDYFEPGAFRSVQQPLEAGADIVVGRVRIHGATGAPGINDPKVTLPEMLRWWENDAYCYNPTGYFYRRSVQEQVGPFNVDDHYTMDYEFLIEAARRFKFVKIPAVLGNFRLIPGTKSVENEPNTLATFRRFEKFADYLKEPQRGRYLEELEAFKASVKR